MAHYLNVQRDFEEWLASQGVPAEPAAPVALASPWRVCISTDRDEDGHFPCSDTPVCTCGHPDW